jgi:hypothetical protein
MEEQIICCLILGLDIFVQPSEHQFGVPTLAYSRKELFSCLLVPIPAAHCPFLS